MAGRFVSAMLKRPGAVVQAICLNKPRHTARVSDPHRRNKVLRTENTSPS